MQKAMMILTFWEGMSHEARNKFLDHIEELCSPFKEYYDDDMTESDDADLKKVTIQIKVSSLHWYWNLSEFVRLSSINCKAKFITT